MSELSTSAKLYSFASGLIDKAIEMRYFMLFLCFLLAIDSCLILFYEKNMYQSLTSFSAPELSFGSGLTFIAIFTFIMSLFFPSIRKIIRFLLAFTKFYSFQNKSFDSGSDWKFASLLASQAIREKDSFLLDRIAEHNHSNKEKDIDLNIAFSLATLLVINYFLVGGDGIVSFTQLAHAFVNREFGFFLSRMLNAGIAIFVVFIAFMGWESIAHRENDRIYWPDDRDKKKKTFPVEDFYKDFNEDRAHTSSMQDKHHS